jgi:multiple sugar transport system substrate-binding protein
MLAGCGGGGSQNDPAVRGQGGGAGNGGKSYDGPKVNLAFWNGFTGGDGPFMQKLVDQFSNEHENIQVKMNTVQWSDYYQKVPSAVASGKGPDVGIMHVDELATNAVRGVIIPLDDVADSLGLKEADFAPVVWNAGVYDNKRYGIPLDIHPFAMFYNRGVLERAGMDPDEPPRDGDEFVAALDELKASGLRGFWVMNDAPAGVWVFQALLTQFGGTLYNEGTAKATFNSDEGVKALAWLVDRVRDGHSAENVTEESSYTAFLNGKNAFFWNGPYRIDPLGEIPDLDWGVAPLPVIGTERGTWGNSHNFVVMRQRQPDDNRLQASKVFINWVSERSIEWAKAGQVPARKSVRESREFQDLRWQPKFAEELPYTHFNPSVPGISQVQLNGVEEAVNEAVLLKKEPKTALDEAAARADQLLEENRRQYQA